MSASSPRLIVLDRDGVINEDLWGYVTKIEDFSPIEGSLDAIARLTKAKFLIYIATNQACINKGLINEVKLNEIHEYMLNLINDFGGKIELITFCPHTPDEKCQCRKPETGLLEKIEKHAGRSLKGSFFIGDKESDWICAEKFGCTPLLVKTGYGEKTISSMVTFPKERIFKNLFAAVEYILC